MTIVLPGDKRPSSEEQFRQFVRAQLYNQDMNLLNLQNNFVALKNILKVSDEKMQAEINRMNEEMKTKVPVVSDETKTALKAFEVKE